MSQRLNLPRLRRMGLFLVLLVSCASGEISQKANSFSGFLGKTTSGTRVSFDEFQGKILIVNFWGTYCPPCRDELPLLESLQRAYGERIHVVAVNFWESNYTVKSFERKNPDLNITVLTDSRHQVARRFHVREIPATFLFNTDGSLMWKKTGYTEASLDDLISEINKLLELQTTGQSESDSS
jgi:thiol-disulfide isomerase/thioredoxin